MTIYLTPAGSLWLLLQEEEGKPLMLRLDDGEVMRFTRPLSELCRFGWRVWTEEGEREARWSPWREGKSF